MWDVSKTSIDYYILPNKMMCSLLGVSPTDRKYSIRGKIFAYFRFAVSLASALSLVVPQIMLVAVKWGDLKILTAVGCMITTLGQYVFKMIYLMARRQQTYKFCKELRGLWDSTYCDSSEKQSYEGFDYWAKIITIFFVTFGLWVLIVYIIIAAFDYFIKGQYEENRHLPIDVWYGTDVTASPKYEIAFVCQLFAALIVSPGLWSIETSCMTTILHMCGQFKLVNDWISKLGVVISNQPTDCYGKYPPNIEADLIRCIRHHQRIIKVLKELNNLLTPIAFVQVFTSGIEICLSGFAVLSMDSRDEFFLSTSYLSSMLMQLLLWCWPGEILIQKSLEVGQVVYLNIPWYRLPPHYQKQILLMMLRSQRSCSISAMTFEKLSFRTLTSVFNAASSYFALLRQIQTS